ncbi:MAG: phosphoadenosine phosphosulfate reductase family protein [Methanosarcinaceae archaeon]|nr:phosphoadenosine phosphosulfate reductase family protein [Methanosarcinaceae archaeon]
MQKSSKEGKNSGSCSIKNSNCEHSSRFGDSFSKRKHNLSGKSSQKKTRNSCSHSSSNPNSRNYKNRNYKSRTPNACKHKASGKQNPSHRLEYEDNLIFWCKTCNLPLIGKECGLCGKPGERLYLSQPADVRFCSPYERKILAQELMSNFGCEPLGKRIVLLNKIPGEDKTDEVLVDGFVFGILRFELAKLDYTFEPSLAGAQILLEQTEKKRVCLGKTKKHLNGKNIGPELINSFSSDIKKGDYVLVSAGRLKGYGVSYIEALDFGSKKELGLPEKILRIRKIESGKSTLASKTPDLQACIEANRKQLQTLGKNAINTIRGIANQKEHRKLPVYVSFSGGKDSLVALDLTKAALKQRKFKAFFLNTGLEFPETLDFARKFCRKSEVSYEEKDAGGAFWANVEKFGPPAKDFRWCCKVCKLASAGNFEEEGKEKDRDIKRGREEEKERNKEKGKEGKNSNIRHKNENPNGISYLTIDGKRKHESFSRAGIAASEKNPFVPSQLNIFPLRDWRALEVWLYIHWRKLPYNPLYDQGFERVGCWLCPAALAAEYERVKVLHPAMYAKWNTFLLKWAKKQGLSDKFIEYGFWRWKELPPKMLKLAKELGINVRPEVSEEEFELEVTGGISPCKAGGFSVEAGLKGIRVAEATEFLNIVGKCIFSEELGMLLVKTDKGTAKFFSNGNLLVSSETKEKALGLFREIAKQLLRFSRCTSCGICVKTCPVGAISLEAQGVHIMDNCIRCGKCTESCVVTKYFDKLLPNLDEKLQI